MDTTPDPTTRRERAADRLAARRRHVRRIRARVAGLSLATLLAASGVMLVQLVTGHDPALARDASANASVHAGSSSSSSARSGAASAGRSSASSAAVRPSAVTTSAS